MNFPGAALRQPVAARVADAGGSPVAGVAVSFDAVAGNGTASPSTEPTDADAGTQGPVTVTLGQTPEIPTTICWSPPNDRCYYGIDIKAGDSFTLFR